MSAPLAGDVVELSGEDDPQLIDLSGEGDSQLIDLTREAPRTWGERYPTLESVFL